MTDQEILEKAIRNSIDGGWSAEWSAKDQITVYFLLLSDISDDGLEVNLDGNYKSYSLEDYRAFIYNHDFAKALWGGYIDDAGVIHKTRPAGIPTTARWIRHLQQMVIADDPIKYLGENL